MSSGVIDVIMSDRISYYSRKLVGILKQAVIADTLSPFDGEIRSQGGLIKTVDDPRLSNESVITMDWLNDNVIGHVPEISEITDDVDKKSVKVSGGHIRLPSGKWKSSSETAMAIFSMCGASGQVKCNSFRLGSGR